MSMNVSTNQIPLFLSCAMSDLYCEKTNLAQCAQSDIRDTNYGILLSVSLLGLSSSKALSMSDINSC